MAYYTRPEGGVNKAKSKKQTKNKQNIREGEKERGEETAWLVHTWQQQANWPHLERDRERAAEEKEQIN